MDALYTAEAHATAGREVRVRSSDGVLDVELRPPRELGKLDASLFVDGEPLGANAIAEPAA